MYSHNMVGSNDMEASKKFYDATFQAIGGKPGIQDEKGRLIYMHNGGLFLVTAPIDGQPDRFRLVMTEMPRHRFDMTVTKAVPSEAYTFSTDIQPPGASQAALDTVLTTADPEPSA